MFNINNIDSLKAVVKASVEGFGLHLLHSISIVTTLEDKEYKISLGEIDSLLSINDEIEIFLPRDVEKRGFTMVGENVRLLKSYEKIVLLNNKDYGEATLEMNILSKVNKESRNQTVYFFRLGSDKALCESDLSFNDLKLLPKIDVKVSGWFNSETKRIYKTTVLEDDLVKKLNSIEMVKVFTQDLRGYSDEKLKESIHKLKVEDDILKNSFSNSAVHSNFLLKGFHLNLEIDFKKSFETNDLAFKRAEISNLSRFKDRMKMYFFINIRPFLVMLFIVISLLLLSKEGYLYSRLEVDTFITQSIFTFISVIIVIIYFGIYMLIDKFKTIESEEKLRNNYSIIDTIFLIILLPFLFFISFLSLKGYNIEGNYFLLTNSKIISNEKQILVPITEIFSYDKITSRYRVLDYKKSNSKTYIYNTKGVDFSDDIKVRTIEYEIVLTKGDYLLEDNWKGVVIKAEKEFFAYINNNPINNTPESTLGKELLYSEYKKVFLESYLSNDFNLTIDSVQSLDFEIKKGEIKK